MGTKNPLNELVFIVVETVGVIDGDGVMLGDRVIVTLGVRVGVCVLVGVVVGVLVSFGVDVGVIVGVGVEVTFGVNVGAE